MHVFLKIFVILVSLCFTMIALLSAINPYLVWKITESWKSVREPSRTYFLLQRILGIIFTAVGLYFLIIFIKF